MKEERDGVLYHHRADVVGNRSTVIELQHSPISVEDIQAREHYYGLRGPMIWLFDGQRFNLGWVSGHRRRCTLRWKHAHPSILRVTKPMFWDVGDLGAVARRVLEEANRACSEAQTAFDQSVEGCEARPLRVLTLEEETSERMRAIFARDDFDTALRRLEKCERVLPDLRDAAIQIPEASCLFRVFRFDRDKKDGLLVHGGFVSREEFIYRFMLDVLERGEDRTEAVWGRLARVADVLLRCKERTDRHWAHKVQAKQEAERKRQEALRLEALRQLQERREALLAGLRKVPWEELFRRAVRLERSNSGLTEEDQILLTHHHELVDRPQQDYEFRFLSQVELWPDEKWEGLKKQVFAMKNSGQWLGPKLFAVVKYAKKIDYHRALRASEAEQRRRTDEELDRLLELPEEPV